MKGATKAAKDGTNNIRESARAPSSLSKRSRIIARVRTIPAAPPNPCRSRKPIKNSIVVAIAQRTLEAV